MLEYFPLILMGLIAGLMHAFDADHVVAVTSLYGQQKISGKRSNTLLRVCMQWALGHGLMLSCIVALVLGVGLTLPDSFSVWAERLVGVVLISIGVLLLWKLTGRKLTFSVHQHDGLEPHGHFHQHEIHAGQGITDHKPVLVGLLHGAAGSAPLLALLPALTDGRLLLAVIYILVFSLAVALSMILFGGLLARGVRTFQHKVRSANGSPFYGVLAALSIACGVFWVAG